MSFVHFARTKNQSSGFNTNMSPCGDIFVCVRAYTKALPELSRSQNSLRSFVLPGQDASLSHTLETPRFSNASLRSAAFRHGKTPVFPTPFPFDSYREAIRIHSVLPVGIEPTSQLPQSRILSIERREQCPTPYQNKAALARCAHLGRVTATVRRCSDFYHLQPSTCLESEPLHDVVRERLHMVLFR